MFFLVVNRQKSLKSRTCSISTLRLVVESRLSLPLTRIIIPYLQEPPTQYNEKQTKLKISAAVHCGQVQGSHGRTDFSGNPSE